MPLKIESIAESHVPVDVREVCQAAMSGMARRDIERITIRIGASPCALADLFRVRGKAHDQVVEWSGSLSNVHFIGCDLAGGEVHVQVAAGDFLGRNMRGGTILVHGSVGQFLGQGMRGGQITVHGMAGDFAGGASAVSRYGLAGGKLLIHGSAGAHAGHRMRRGLLAIAHDAGDFAARGMLAGTIVVAGACGRLPGTSMKRGTLLLHQRGLEQLPATFVRACQWRPLAVDLLLASLRRSNFPCPDSIGPCEMFQGDQLEGGRGEVFGWTNREPRA